MIFRISNVRLSCVVQIKTETSMLGTKMSGTKKQGIYMPGTDVTRNYDACN